VFVDDILIYSKSLSEHLDHLKQVFSILQQHQLYLKRSKCSFDQRSLEYLGHVISEQGVSTDSKKTEAIANWPTPTDAKQLRSFLGLSSYYRKFIQGYDSISQPLTDLLKKNAIFQWTPNCNSVSAPVLALPDFTKGFHLETDASGTSIGAGTVIEQPPYCLYHQGIGTQGLGYVYI
jgi:hypothetical protein